MEQTQLKRVSRYQNLKHDRKKIFKIPGVAKLQQAFKKETNSLPSTETDSEQQWSKKSAIDPELFLTKKTPVNNRNGIKIFEIKKCGRIPDMKAHIREGNIEGWFPRE